MWKLRFKDKDYTCPKGNLKGLALIQAMDKGITRGPICDDITAKEYLESEGFVIEDMDEPTPLDEIPKVVNYNDRRHRDLYMKLFYQKMDRPLTEEEERFCISMYHAEEFACGLDG